MFTGWMTCIPAVLLSLVTLLFNNPDKINRHKSFVKTKLLLPLLR